jgi:hypothetical protein
VWRLVVLPQALVLPWCHQSVRPRESAASLRRVRAVGR